MGFQKAQELLAVQPTDVLWTLLWFALYFALSRANFKTPAAVAANPARKLEWDMRLVSNVHAIALLVGSVQTFRECLEVCLENHLLHSILLVDLISAAGKATDLLGLLQLLGSSPHIKYVSNLFS